MAGAIKHMERSHRATALKRNAGVFNQFNRRAYTVQNTKQNIKQKMTLGQYIKNALKRAVGKEA